MTITPSREFLAWGTAHVGEGREFAALTHAAKLGWAILHEPQAAITEFETTVARIEVERERAAARLSKPRATRSDSAC